MTSIMQKKKEYNLNNYYIGNEDKSENSLIINYNNMRISISKELLFLCNKKESKAKKDDQIKYKKF